MAKYFAMRLTPLVLLLALLALGFTACGDDDDDGGSADQPQAFEVEATDDGVTAPETARPGAIEIRFSNTGEQEHSAQIVRLDDGHTAEEGLEAGNAWGEKGEALADWLTFEGGIGTTEPGGSGVAVVDLTPGEYAVFDIQGRGDAPYAEFTVEGDEGEGLPAVSASVEAVDYGFNASELKTGSQSVLFENTGEEPHHLLAAPTKPGTTLDELREAATSDDAPPPIDESKAFNVAIVSGGESAIVDLRFESGDYGLFCFIPDRAGGPPHVNKGMVALTTVE